MVEKYNKGDKMKRLTVTCLLLLFATTLFAQVSTGGSIDVSMGSNQKAQGTGSWNLEYKLLSFVSTGIKLSGQTDFENMYAVTPSIFARLYPFSGAFAEANLGGKFSWTNQIFSQNFTLGGAIGWRITSGNTYIEPKLNFDYVFGAKEPFSWSGGVGAGYSF